MAAPRPNEPLVAKGRPVVAGAAALEAAELLGMSERASAATGNDRTACDRRLGKASARRVPADQVAWVLDEPKMDGRTSTRAPRLRLEPGRAWSASTVAEPNAFDSRRAAISTDRHHGRRPAHRVHEQVFTDKGLPGSLYTDRGSHYFQRLRRAEWTRATRPRSAAPSTSSASNTSPTRRHAAAPSAPSVQNRLVNQSPASPRSRPQTASQTHICPISNRSQRLRPPPPDAGPRTKARGRARQYRAPRKTGPANPRQPGQTPLRQGHGPGARVSRRHTRPLPRTPMPRPLSGRRRAHRLSNRQAA